MYLPNLKLISLENIPCIHLLLHIIKATIITVCDDCLTLCFKFFQVIHYFTSKECCSIFKCWLVNDYGCSFCFNTLHDSLNTTLAEVIRIALHCQSVYTNNNFMSSPIVHSLMYCLSSFTTSSKSVMLLRPLTCHIPVSPGLVARRAR